MLVVMNRSTIQQLYIYTYGMYNFWNIYVYMHIYVRYVYWRVGVHAVW